MHFFVTPGLLPLLPGLTSVDRVHGLVPRGLSAHRSGRSSGCGTLAPPVRVPRCHPGPVPGASLSDAAPEHFSTEYDRRRPPHPGPLPVGEKGSCGAASALLLPSRKREGPGEGGGPVGSEHAVARLPLELRCAPRPSCPDLFRASTSGRRLVPSRPAPRCRKAWMAGTSPAMTVGGDKRGRDGLAHGQGARAEAEPDSGGASPGMTGEGRRCVDRDGRWERCTFAPTGPRTGCRSAPARRPSSYLYEPLLKCLRRRSASGV